MQVHCQLRMLNKSRPLKFNCSLSNLPRKGEIIHFSNLRDYTMNGEKLAAEDSSNWTVSVVEVMHLSLDYQEHNKLTKSVVGDAVAVLYLEEKDTQLFPVWAP